MKSKTRKQKKQQSQSQSSSSLSQSNNHHRTLSNRQEERKVEHTKRKEEQKRRHQRNNHKIPNVHDLIRAAEQVTTSSSNPQDAIGLYTAAVQQLVQQLQQQTQASHDVVNGDHNNINNGQTLIKTTTQTTTTDSSSKDIVEDHNNNVVPILMDVYEKRAELYVSISAHEDALHDFQSALNLIPTNIIIELQQQQQSLLTTDPNKMESFINMIEKKGSYHMYIGQLCIGLDAYQSYQKGIECLEYVYEYREKKKKQQQEQNNKNKDVDMIIIQQQQQQQQQQPNETLDDDHVDASQEQQQTTTTTIKQKLIAAYCTTCELFMTDLCYEINAEEQCEFYLSKALLLPINNNTTTTTPSLPTTATTDPDPTTLISNSSVDALQIGASHRLSQCRFEEATYFILQAYEQIRIGCSALSSLVGIRKALLEDDGLDQNHGTAVATELQNVKEVNELPGYEFRCQTAKVLLECASHCCNDTTETTEVFELSPERSSVPSSKLVNEWKHLCVENALDVLGSLLAENDEVIEIWNLIGDAFAFKQKMDSVRSKNQNQNQLQQPEKEDENDNNNDDDDILDDDDDDDDNNTNHDPSEQRHKNVGNNGELALYYWNRAMEMLETVQESLLLEQQEQDEEIQEDQDNDDDDDDDNNNKNDDDSIQQQLDEIQCQLDDIRSKMNQWNDDDDDNDNGSDHKDTMEAMEME